MLLFSFVLLLLIFGSAILNMREKSCIRWTSTLLVRTSRHCHQSIIQLAKIRNQLWLIHWLCFIQSAEFSYPTMKNLTNCRNCWNDKTNSTCVSLPSIDFYHSLYHFSHWLDFIQNEIRFCCDNRFSMEIKRIYREVKFFRYIIHNLSQNLHNDTTNQSTLYDFKW